MKTFENFVAMEHLMNKKFSQIRNNDKVEDIQKKFR